MEMKVTRWTAATADFQYPPPPLPEAIQIAQEFIDEWDYESDPHGYCHTRPMLISLVSAAREVAAAREP